MRKQIIAAAVTAAVTAAFGCGMAVAQSVININPQGSGGTLAVGALDFLPGNAIATPAGGSAAAPTAGVLQIYGHGRLWKACSTPAETRLAAQRRGLNGLMYSASRS